MPSQMANGAVEYVAAAYIITWVVLAATLVRVIGAARRGRAEFDSASKGEFRT